MRLAIGQVRMHWTIADNLAELVRAMSVARAAGAGLCVFPELAIPGFHREIAALARPALIAPAVDTLREAAAAHGLALAFGAPTFDAEGIRNSALLVDAQGRLVATIHKSGLTAPEATFFAAGTGPRAIAPLCGLHTSVVLCREIEDGDALCRELQDGGLDLLLWPGQMRPDPALPPTDPPAHVVQAQALAARLRVPIVQANWPNALNRPEESAGTGHSAVIDASGALLFRLPKATPGVAVFDLGEHRFDWFAAGA